MRKIYRFIRPVHLPFEAASLLKRAANGYKKIVEIGDKNGVRFIAHRGLSALYRENTVSSFKAAAKEYDFKGNNYIVFPIKVNQMRPVVDEIVSHGK